MKEAEDLHDDVKYPVKLNGKPKKGEFYKEKIDKAK